MHVVYVSHSIPPHGRPLSNVGGMQRVAAELLRTLSKQPDVRVTPIVLRCSWRWTHVRVVPFWLSTWLRLRKMTRRQDVDLVLFSSMVTATLSPVMQRLFRENQIKTAAIAHGRDVTLMFNPYQRLLRRMFRALDLLLPVSRATAQALHERGVPESKIRVVPNGIDLVRFSHPESRTLNVTQPPPGVFLPELPEGSKLLCSVGRQVKRKGFRWFVREVMPLLPDNVHYWLVGEGPESAGILEEAERRGLSGRVRLLGRVPEDLLIDFYRRADLFIMPNIPVPGDMEGFGVVMLEAGLCGLPSIAARLEGIRDVVLEGVNGHLVPPGDAAAYVAAIMPYLTNEQSLAEASDRAATYVRSTFGWNAVAHQHLRALADLTNTHFPPFSSLSRENSRMGFD